tara:strand:- start:529 stop:837 length:309 start_codon:yes stop_codon:yes gene_type:complete
MNKYFSKLVNEVSRWKWNADIVIVRKAMHLELDDDRFLVINEMPYDTNEVVVFDTFCDIESNFHTKTYYVSTDESYEKACTAIYNLSEDYAVAQEKQEAVVT